MTHMQHAFGSFTPHGEGLREQLVDGLSLLEALPKFGCLRTDLGVGERDNLRLELTNALGQWTNPPQLALVLARDDFWKKPT